MIEHDILHQSLIRAERKIELLKNNPAPTIPVYDLNGVTAGEYLPYVGKVLKCRYNDSTDPTGPFVALNLYPASRDFWLGLDFAISSGSWIADLISSGSAFDLIDFFYGASNTTGIWLWNSLFGNEGYLSFDIPGSYESDFDGVGIDGPIVGDTWYHIDFHNKYDIGTSTFEPELWVDGVDQGISGKPSVGDSHADLIVIGNYGWSGSGENDVYYRNIFLGTTRGGFDIAGINVSGSGVVPPFADTYPSGTDFIANGQLSVIDDPFA